MLKKNEAFFDSVPEYIYDRQSDTVYKRTRFFGKGTFGHCYEVQDLRTKILYATKVIPKIATASHRLMEEFHVHGSLSHPSIVQFFKRFDDTYYTYVIMELCVNNSMADLCHRRQTITEYECRYYISQISRGVDYLHKNHIVHRDLKLNNIFLNRKLCIKIGDFGLATRMRSTTDQRDKMCGTLEYMAPEVINKAPYSYEVDVWAIGCIAYVLLTGKLPFTGKTSTDTIDNIKNGTYCMPTTISKLAIDMIQCLLQQDQKKRITAEQIIHLDFIKYAPIPSCLPKSCLTMPPRLDIQEIHMDASNDFTRLYMHNGDQAIMILGAYNINSHLSKKHYNIEAERNYTREQYEDVSRMHDFLEVALQCKPTTPLKCMGDINNDPTARPFIWVCSQNDKRDKFGLGYQLSDGTIGIVFNDLTRMLLLPNQFNVHYIDTKGREVYMTTEHYDDMIKDKMEALMECKTEIMARSLLNLTNIISKNHDYISRPPHLVSWSKIDNNIMMHLSNGTFQINYDDRTAIILCSRVGAISYLDLDGKLRTYRINTIPQHGYPSDIYLKLKFAHERISDFLKLLTKTLNAD